MQAATCFLPKYFVFDFYHEKIKCTFQEGIIYCIVYCIHHVLISSMLRDDVDVAAYVYN